MTERAMFLSDAEFTALVRRLCVELNGLSVAQIDHALNVVRELVALSTPFSTESAVYQAKVGRAGEAAERRAH
jgi:hypothetical protein